MGVVILNVPTDNGGAIYPVILEGNDGFLLVDTGFPEQFDALVHAVEASGLSMDELKTVLFTHQDLDHIGNAREIKKRYPM